jgi:hypothetical protein
MVMINVHRIAEFLEGVDGIRVVEVGPEWVVGMFPSRVDSKRLHELVIRPDIEEGVVTILVPQITTTNSTGNLPRVLLAHNYHNTLGKVGVDDDDGELSLEIAQACRDGAEEDPSQEVLTRLCERAIDKTHELVTLTTYLGMIEAGVSPAVAQRFVAQIREPDYEDDDEESSRRNSRWTI